LAYIHERNIVHRDVKPSNSFLSIAAKPGYELPIVKLGDLGLACELRSRMTPTVGTFRYMAPEVIDQEIYGFGADVFACGMSLHEVITGKVPFQDICTKNYIPVAILKGKRPDLQRLRDGTVNELLANIVEVCWVQNPADRPSIADLLVRLRAAVAQDP